MTSQRSFGTPILPLLSRFSLKRERFTCLKLFYDCVRDVDEIDTKICARLDPPATGLRDVASIRSAWRTAEVNAMRFLEGDPVSYS